MTGKQHNATLDGLRGVAACTVVWFHMVSETARVAIPFHGYLAVDFFFILSGFVIARSYEDRLAAEMTLATFIRLRLIRLYPLIMLGMLCGAISKYVLLHAHLYQIAAALFFGLMMVPYAGLHVPGGRALFPLDGPLWSLMLEIWINILFAVAVKLGHGRSFVLLTLSAGGMGVVFFALKQANLDGGTTFDDYYVGLARVGFAFSAGVVLHWLLTPTRLDRLPKVPFLILAAALLLVLAERRTFGGAYDIIAVILVFPFLIALGVRDVVARRVRSFALLAGALSYPVYVLHAATFVHLNRLYGHSFAVILASCLAAFLAVLGCSYIAMRFYDEPVREWLRSRKRPAAVNSPY